MKKIPVLDHGYVRLVDHMGSDLSVVRSARVSYDAEWRTGVDAGADEKLLRYLLTHRHTSPFEAVTLTFEVKAPIFVFRQWHRHRTWCLSGNTPLTFNRSVDGKPYPMRLVDVVRKWNPAPAKRRRVDCSPLSLQEFKRNRLRSMLLRSPAGDVQLVDAWFSGEKPVYRVKTAYGEITASADHVFKTPEGPRRICDSPAEVMAMIRVGDKNHRTPPVFTEQELGKASWVEFADGYEVSDLGQVRSYWRPGSTEKQSTPTLKTITVNAQGRSVVSVKSKALHVSVLVCRAFIGVPGVLQVLHRDDNPHNNRVSNLYLGTPKDNAKDQYLNGGRVRLQEVPVKIQTISAQGVEPTFDLTVTGDHWFVADNLVVHNSYNEISARYSELPEEFYIPDLEQITTQSKTNKQMRTDRQHPNALPWRESMLALNKKAFKAYRGMVMDGVPRELARTILPVATYSKMFGTVNLHNLLHFLLLRLHPHAQHEIRVYAEAMAVLASNVAPITMRIWGELHEQSVSAS